MITRRDVLAGIAAIGGVAASGAPALASFSPQTPSRLEGVGLEWLNEAVFQLDMLRWLGHGAAYDAAMLAFAHENEHDHPDPDRFKRNAVISYHNSLRPSERRWRTEGVEILVEIGRRGKAWPDLPAYTHQDGSSFRAYLVEFNRNHAFGYGPWLRRRFNGIGS